MARVFVTSINLNKNELLNARIQNLSAAPSSPVSGQIYYNSTDNILYFYNGTSWIQATGDAETVQDIVASYVVGGTGITKTYDDTANTLTLAINNAVVATLTDSQTLTNKTLTSPTVSGLSLSDSSVVFEGATADAFETTLTVTDPTADRTVTIPDATTTLVGRDTTDTLTNKSISLGSNTVTTTIAQLNSAVTDADLATIAGTETLTNKTLTSPTVSGLYVSDSSIVFEGATNDNFETTLTVADPTSDQTITLPNATDTLVGKATTDTLTNKTISGATNTLTNIANASLTNSTISGKSLGNNLDALTISTGLSGTTYNGSSAVTIAIDSTVATLSGTQALTNKTLGSGTALSANLAAGSNKITGLADPTSAQDAATKAYVDAAVSGLNVHDSVSVATTANIVGTYAAGTAGADGGLGVGATLTVTATGVWTIDGYTPALNERVLVKDQTTQTQNGVYYVTTVGTTGVSAVLTRALSEDNSIAGDLTAGDFVFVVNGTANQKTGWVQSNQGTSTSPIKGIKIGTDNIAFTQFSGAGTYTAGTGLTSSGTTFNVGAGTGITVNADDVAIDTSVVARKYTSLIGNGALTSIPVTHSLGNQYVTAQVFDASSNTLVDCDVTLSSSSQITLGFATAPTTNQYRVVVIG